MTTSKTETCSTETSDDIFARALRRARARASSAARAPALAGALALAGPVMAGCEMMDLPAVTQDEQALDWAQNEGQRNTAMVSYLGEHWSMCTDYNTRFGCGEMTVMLKVRVKPVAGADLFWKRVGVVYKNPEEGGVEHTAAGYYFTTWGNGDEEWHVPVVVPSYRDYFTFNVWYQDGAAHTYYDDNNGEYHAVNGGHPHQMIRVNTYSNTVQLTEAGVQGSVSLRVADLDYDKQIVMHATTDGWSNTLVFGMGSPGEKNVWYWQQDVSGGEYWQIDLDLPGDFQELQYAVAYRHGVVNGATTYEFWDNNHGANHRVTRVVE